MDRIERELKPHPGSKAIRISGVRASLEYDQDRFQIAYVVDAPADALVLPVPAAPCRADGLWRSTCFELFLRNAGQEYLEFNFSPSGQWAAYRFSGYREGMQPLPLDAPPVIENRDQTGRYSLTAVLVLPRAAPLGFGISAVIELRGGAKSFWALEHPQGKPDFHHADSFVEFSP